MPSTRSICWGQRNENYKDIFQIFGMPARLVERSDSTNRILRARWACTSASDLQKVRKTSRGDLPTKNDRERKYVMHRLDSDSVTGKLNVCVFYMIGGHGVGVSYGQFSNGDFWSGIIGGLCTLIVLSIGLDLHIRSASEAYTKGLNEPRPGIRSVGVDE